MVALTYVAIVYSTSSGEFLEMGFTIVQYQFPLKWYWMILGYLQVSSVVLVMQETR